MKKIIFCTFVSGLIVFAINISGSFLLNSEKDSFNRTSLSDQIGIVSVLSAGTVYAASDKSQGKALGHLKDKNKKPKKPKKPKKDKGKGPSLPALPMVSSVILGLGAVGWGRYFFRKQKE